ncbi:hypothetical protein ES703_47797 [subsurface metagenome]
MERTEEEKIVQSGIKVILGGEEYLIKPLVIRDSREWRAKVVKLLAPLPGYTEANSDNPDKFSEALNAIMVTMPDQIVELFFDYAKDLNRDDIESKASDAEVAKAFEQVVEIAFPLSQSMVVAMEIVTPKTKKSR